MANSKPTANGLERVPSAHLKMPTPVFNRFLDRISSAPTEGGGIVMVVDRANREIRVSRHDAAEVVCIPFEALVSYTVAAPTKEG